MDLESWAGSVDLSTPAGRLLQDLAAALPKDGEFSITVFGSAPLQICIDAALTSADIDLFSEHGDLQPLVDQLGFGPEREECFIQVGTELNFQTSPRWRTRTRSVGIENCTFVFPHPIDILIAKLNRLEPKDIEAFQVVRSRTGHPTEKELIDELQMSVDLFRPGFDEESHRDLAGNCQRLWPTLYGREIDSRQEIIAPALERRRQGYGDPSRDFNQELRDALDES